MPSVLNLHAYHDVAIQKCKALAKCEFRRILANAGGQAREGRAGIANNYRHLPEPASVKALDITQVG